MKKLMLIMLLFSSSQISLFGTAKGSSSSSSSSTSLSGKEQLNKLLIQKVISNNYTLEELEELLNKGADVNATDSHGSTALIYSEDPETVEFLLSKNAEVNAKDNEGITALMRAEDAEMATLLLNAGADVNARDSDGETALTKAAYLGKKDLVKLFLDRGADVNAKTLKGFTALTNSLDPEIVKLLLERYADFDIPNEKGVTFLNQITRPSNQGIRKVFEDFQEANKKYREEVAKEIKKAKGLENLPPGLAELMASYTAPEPAKK